MDTSLALTSQTGWLLPGMRETAARYFRMAVPTVAGARSGKSAGHFPLYALPGAARGSAGTAGTATAYAGC
jgi:hypothetical protein